MVSLTDRFIHACGVCAGRNARRSCDKLGARTRRCHAAGIALLRILSFSADHSFLGWRLSEKVDSKRTCPARRLASLPLLAHLREEILLLEKTVHGSQQKWFSNLPRQCRFGVDWIMLEFLRNGR